MSSAEVVESCVRGREGGREGDRKGG